MGPEYGFTDLARQYGGQCGEPAKLFVPRMTEKEEQEALAQIHSDLAR